MLVIEWRRWSVWLSRMSPKKETIVSRPSSGPIESMPTMWIVAVASAVSVVAISSRSWRSWAAP